MSGTFKHDDEALLEGCLNGSAEAWRAFVDRFSDAVYGTIRAVLRRNGLGRRHDLVDDVYQEVFCDIYAKRRLARLDRRKSVKSYICAICVSKTVDLLRTLKPMTHFTALDAHGDGRVIQSGVSGPEQNVREAETARYIRQTLDALSAKEQCVMRLVLDQELTYRETGQLMGLPENSVATIVRRTKQKIMDHLRQAGLIGEDRDNRDGMNL